MIGFVVIQVKVGKSIKFCRASLEMINAFCVMLIMYDVRMLNTKENLPINDALIKEKRPPGISLMIKR